MADRTHLYTVTQLRALRLKPGIGQQPAARYWQGHRWVDLYDTLETVTMRPHRTASAAQAQALARGRALVGMAYCACGAVVAREQLHHNGGCPDCWERDQEVEWQAKLCDMQRRAAEILALDPLVIDTETTGLGPDAEIIEITVLDMNGAVLLDTLVRPAGPIEPAARAVHGISTEYLVNAPTWPVVHASIAALLQGRVAVAFNAPFDERMIRQTCKQHDLPAPVTAAWFCTMDLATPLNNGRWPSLSCALKLAGALPQHTEHRSLPDASNCLTLLQKLAVQR